MQFVQLVGALVVQAQAGIVPAGLSSMVLTRYYARIPFGNYEMELSRTRDARFISVTLHADNATGLLAQVWSKGRFGAVSSFTDIRYHVVDTLLPSTDCHPLPLPALCTIGCHQRRQACPCETYSTSLLLAMTNRIAISAAGYLADHRVQRTHSYPSWQAQGGC